ncbi:hypothetical protein KC343_g468 [Hortaea werneckii]|nr:hypothetical protein KC352_g9758 [Hortaea werneckii]KAI7572696.1 hypothetical protein KC317_g517 [Hortaea werneckii]KAI7621140.1 hypothetical protein KC346_g3778 [Hortaea werneckii]KAI7637874.1 hypothetical protein KC343_g468 [Hortaea werneckii]
MKLVFLRDKINKVLLAEIARVVPNQLRDVNYTRWTSLQAALTTMENILGRLDTVERLGHELYEHGPDGSKDLSALHALSGVLEEEGKYSEAEVAARLVLPWLQSQPKLGDGSSPQALGSMKIIVKSLWKQGKITEAQIWVEE